MELRRGQKFRSVRMSALTPGLLTIPAGADLALAAHLHHAAHEKCYVANSLNFPILCEPVIELSA